MTSQSKRKGFTLVELLVVVTIVMLATGLVGGLVVDGYSKFQGKAELKQFEQIILKATSKAFLLEKTLLLKVRDNQLKVYFEEQLIQENEFDYLSFYEDEILINRLGLASKSQLSVLILGRRKVVLLNEISRSV